MLYFKDFILFLLNLNFGENQNILQNTFLRQASGRFHVMSPYVFQAIWCARDIPVRIVWKNYRLMFTDYEVCNITQMCHTGKDPYCYIKIPNTGDTESLGLCG